MIGVNIWLRLINKVPVQENTEVRAKPYSSAGLKVMLLKLSKHVSVLLNRVVLLQELS